jgi:hypothetical protein
MMSNYPSWEELLSRPAGKAHMVQLYRDPAVLRTSVTRYLSDGFRDGASAVVIATGDHWSGFRQGLESRNHDPSRMEHEGRLAVLDARSTLETFMRHGMPDEALFQRAVGAVLLSLSAQGTPNIRAYGEMVSLLWADRRFDAALRLEELWNSLAERRPFTLLCAYEGDALAPEFHSRPAESVFQQHSHVVPAEDDERLNGAVWQAMEEVLGKAEAEALRPLVAATRRRVALMPGPQATLLWLQYNLPHHVEAVLSAARRLIESDPGD